MNQKQLAAFAQAARSKVMIRGHARPSKPITLAADIITAPFEDGRWIWVQCHNTYGGIKSGITVRTLDSAEAIAYQLDDGQYDKTFFSSVQALVTLGEDASIDPPEFHMMGFWNFALGCLKQEMYNLPCFVPGSPDYDMARALTTLIERFEGFIRSMTKIHWSSKFGHALD